eukprot:TRINITY_DN17951_c0_g1_i1.p1 TRINITY_DN17951_c0_g1~~TRINITY_DN17951_c0_g1_i1.p1  ORF type:complete len:640 (-),score=151.02 TRINITY_DN17951_c0_g1_i1:57-1976(-)
MELLHSEDELDESREMLPSELKAPVRLRPGRTGVAALVIVPMLLVGSAALAWSKRAASDAASRAGEPSRAITVLTDTAADAEEVAKLQSLLSQDEEPDDDSASRRPAPEHEDAARDETDKLEQFMAQAPHKNASSTAAPKVQASVAAEKLEQFIAQTAKPTQRPEQVNSNLENFIKEGATRCMPQCPAVAAMRARRLPTGDDEAALAAFLAPGDEKEQAATAEQNNEVAKLEALLAQVEEPKPKPTSHMKELERFIDTAPQAAQTQRPDKNNEVDHLTQMLNDDQKLQDIKAAEKAQQECEMGCEDQGFLAVKHWRACKADCLMQHPIAGKKVPKEPLVACMDKCPTHGELWHLRFDSCEQRCKSKTFKDEAVYREEMTAEGYPEEMLEINRTVTKAVAVAKVTKRITIKSRPEGKPIAEVFAFYEELWKRSLRKVLQADLGNFIVTLRTYPGPISTEAAEEGRRLQILNDPLAFKTDPGNDIEAVAEISGAPADTIDKLVDPTLPFNIDSTFDALIKTAEFSFLDGAANLLPCEVSETTSVSVDGPYVSMGWNTVCRANEDDHSVDNDGKALVYHDKTLRECSQECEKLGKLQCYGFEYRASRLRCEIWKDPICHSEPLSTLEASVADFRCFKRCTSD